MRASYEVFPGVKPFVEFGADTRKHDLQFDRNGFQRDSQAITPKVGTTFEMTRKLTGEISVGYLTRQYEDPNLAGSARHGLRRLAEMGGHRLTTATLTGSSRGEESVVAGLSGALRRDVGVQVDHALRRWLIWTVRAGYGFDEYVGSRPRRHAHVARHRADLQVQPRALAQGRVPLRPVAIQRPARTTTPTSSWSG